MNPLHSPQGYECLYSAERLGLGAILLLNLFDRLQCGLCGPNPLPSRALTDAVQRIDPGYCIDAPETMPAGGMTNFCTGDMGYDEPVWLPEMLTVERGGDKP